MDQKTERAAALAGARPVENSDAIETKDNAISPKEQAVLDRIDFIVRDIDAEKWSPAALRRLAESASALRSAADAERHRRLPPSEYGGGLLGAIGLLDKEGGGK